MFITKQGTSSVHFSIANEKESWHEDLASLFMPLICGCTVFLLLIMSDLFQAGASTLPAFPSSSSSAFAENGGSSCSSAFGTSQVTTVCTFSLHLEWNLVLIQTNDLDVINFSKQRLSWPIPLFCVLDPCQIGSRWRILLQICIRHFPPGQEKGEVLLPDLTLLLTTSPSLGWQWHFR